MAKLDVPVSSGESQTAPMDLKTINNKMTSAANIGSLQKNQSAQAVAGAAQMGETEMQLGSQIASVGNEYTQKAMKAMTDTMYNIVQSNAASEYNTQANAQLSNISTPSTDGRTNYLKANKLKQTGGTSADLDSIAKSVTSKYGPALQDPISKQKFAQSLGNLNANRKVQAGSIERNSQINLSNQALEQALTSDISTGLIDSPDNLGYYAQQGIERIQSSLQNGTISLDQASQLGDKLRSGLYFGSLQAQNKQDPNSLSMLLQSKSAQDLNLSEVEYQQLVKQNKFSLHDQENLNKIQYNAEQEINNAQSRFIVGSLESGLATGKTTSTDIMSAYDRGDLTFPQFSALAAKYEQKGKVDQKVWAQRQDISASISNGQILSDYDPKQINDHYLNTVKSLSKDGTTNIPMKQKLDIAKHYQGPIDSLANELQYDVKSGNIDKIREASAAFDQLQQQAPLVLSNVKDKDFVVFMSSLSNQLKYSSATDPASIKSLHDSIYNQDGRLTRKYENNFSDESAFSSDQIKKTIANMYSGGNPWYRQADDVSDDIVQQLTPLFRQAYLKTGNAEDAITAVTNITKSIYGHSAVNNVERFGFDSGTIMALPPEIAYAGKATPEQIRGMVNKDIASIVPPGVTPDQVLIGSDDRTLNEFKAERSPSYYLYYYDKNGDEHLIKQRWVMDSKIKPVPSSSVVPTGTSSPVTNTAQATQASALPAASTSTKPPIMDAIDAKVIGSRSKIDQISRGYTGAIDQQPTVAAALHTMVGPDQSSWRLGKSMELVNSILTNNSDPKTYLRIGTSTTNPELGDVVVTGKKAGLFAGTQSIDGQTYIKITSLDGNNLSSELVNASDVQGYRMLPTPENYHQQADAQVHAAPPVAPLDIYGQNEGKNTRIGTGQERFDFINGTTSIEAKDQKPDAKFLNITNGTLDSVNSTFNQELKAAIGEQPANSMQEVKKGRKQTSTSQTQQIIESGSNGTSSVSQDGTSISGQVNVPGNQQYTNADTSQQFRPVDQPSKGTYVQLQDGSMGKFEMYQNGKVRLQDGRTVDKSQVTGYKELTNSSPENSSKVDVTAGETYSSVLKSTKNPQDLQDLKKGYDEMSSTSLEDLQRWMDQMSAEWKERGAYATLDEDVKATGDMQVYGSYLAAKERLSAARKAGKTVKASPLTARQIAQKDKSNPFPESIQYDSLSDWLKALKDQYQLQQPGITMDAWMKLAGAKKYAQYLKAKSGGK